MQGKETQNYVTIELKFGQIPLWDILPDFAESCLQTRIQCKFSVIKIIHLLNLSRIFLDC